MIRLTVMYNLLPDVDENEYLEWRLGEHQTANSSHEGVLRTDFAQATRGWTTDGDTPPRYKFMTTAEWDDMETFERAFYNADLQASMKENMAKLSDDYLYMVTEIVTETKNT